METLWKAGARVRAFDPEAMDECRRIYGEREDLELCTTPEEALAGADALAVVTEWKVFRSPDFDLIQQRLNDPVIFDGRNLYNPNNLRARGITYHAIGRP